MNTDTGSPEYPKLSGLSLVCPTSALTFQSSDLMVSVTQNFAVVGAGVLASLLFMVGLNRLWPWEKRRAYNDLIGSQFGFLGTTYAVFVGFMLFAVWSSFGEADLNVDLEANALVDIYRLADGMPEPQRTQLQKLARSYANAVIIEDWPQMAEGVVPGQTSALNQEMWKTVTSLRAASPTEVNAQESALSELSLLVQHGQTRTRQSTTRLPGVLWCVLLVGGSLTIFSACSFGAESVKLQALNVLIVSVLVSLSLVAIADIHRPFHGLIHVKDDAFRRAQQSMQAR
jgi:Protein of unknown function (DUF4239)